MASQPPLEGWLTATYGHLGVHTGRTASGGGPSARYPKLQVSDDFSGVIHD